MTIIVYIMICSELLCSSPLGWLNESASLAYQKDNILHASRLWTGRIPTLHNQKRSKLRSRHGCVGYHWALLLSSLSLALPAYQLYLEILTLPEDSPLSTLPALWAASTVLVCRPVNILQPILIGNLSFPKGHNWCLFLHELDSCM